MICGDHAWPALPLQAIGGPCSIGRLTITPNLTTIMNHTHQAKHDRRRRLLRAFTAECDPNAHFWNPSLVRVASIFVPGVAAAKALMNL